MTTREKARAREKRWRESNPERVREYRKRWLDKNPEAQRRAILAWKKNNLDRSRENDRNFKRNNPDKCRAWRQENYRNDRLERIAYTRLYLDRKDPLRIAHREVIQTRHTIDACLLNLQRRTA